MKKIDLKSSLDAASYNYVADYFDDFRYLETGLTCFGRYDDREWIKFFHNGHASYCPGSVKDIQNFHSYQDCIDFIRIK